MSKLTLIYGPMGSGKTRNKAAFARHFGHTTVIDGVNLFRRRKEFTDDQSRRYEALPDDALVLAAMTFSETVAFLQKFGRRATVIPIEDALSAIGAPEASK